MVQTTLSRYLLRRIFKEIANWIKIIVVGEHNITGTKLTTKENQWIRKRKEFFNNISYLKETCYHDSIPARKLNNIKKKKRWKKSIPKEEPTNLYLLLSEDEYLLIFSFLDCRGLIRLSQVCSAFYHLSHHFILWKPWVELEKSIFEASLKRVQEEEEPSLSLVEFDFKKGFEKWLLFYKPSKEEGLYFQFRSANAPGEIHRHMFNDDPNFTLTYDATAAAAAAALTAVIQNEQDLSQQETNRDENALQQDATEMDEFSIGDEEAENLNFDDVMQDYNGVTMNPLQGEEEIPDMTREKISAFITLEQRNQTQQLVSSKVDLSTLSPLEESINSPSEKTPIEESEVQSQEIRIEIQEPSVSTENIVNREKLSKSVSTNSMANATLSKNEIKRSLSSPDGFSTQNEIDLFAVSPKRVIIEETIQSEKEINNKSQAIESNSTQKPKDWEKKQEFLLYKHYTIFRRRRLRNPFIRSRLMKIFVAEQKRKYRPITKWFNHAKLLSFLCGFFTSILFVLVLDGFLELPLFVAYTPMIVCACIMLLLIIFLWVPSLNWPLALYRCICKDYVGWWTSYSYSLSVRGRFVQLLCGFLVSIILICIAFSLLFPWIIFPWIPTSLIGITFLLWMYTATQIIYPPAKKVYPIFIVCIAMSMILYSALLTLKFIFYHVFTLYWFYTFVPLWMVMFWIALFHIKLSLDLNKATSQSCVCIGWNIAFVQFLLLLLLGQILVALKLDSFVDWPFFIVCSPLLLAQCIMGSYYFQRSFFPKMIQQTALKNPFTICCHGGVKNNAEMEVFLV